MVMVQVIILMQGNRPTLSYLKTSKRYLQPPTLYNSGLLSSQDRTQNRALHLHQLSNVEQKSYVSSDGHGIDEYDIRQVLAGIQSRRLKAQEPESPKSPRSPLSASIQHRSGSVAPRLEDQEIIAVDEQVDVDSHKGNQSVILEHIDFNNQSNERQPESARPAEVKDLESLKGNGQKYYINCVEPALIAPDIIDGSSSTPNDLSSFQFNPHKVRHSKNTCIERLSSLGAENNLRITNNSCMTKPMAGQERDSINSPKSQQPEEDINIILKKWNNAAFEEGEHRGLGVNRKVNPTLKKGAEYEMQMQGKYCVSQFKEKTVNNQNHEATLKTSSIRHKKEEQVKQRQNEDELLIKYQDVIDKLERLEQQYQLAVKEQSRLAREAAQKELQLTHLTQHIQTYQAEAQLWKDKYHQTNRNQNQAIDQLRRLEARNLELEQTIQKQSDEIRFYQEKNDKLQKQLQKTIRYNDAILLGSNSPMKTSLRMKKFETFGQMTPESPEHKVCLEKIQALQQHIFDIEQKSIGVDIQVDKRVRIIGQHIDLNLRRTIQQQYLSKIASLNDQINRLYAQNKTLQQEKSTFVEQYRSKERDLTDRENKVKKMYDELVIEWREIEKERQKYRELSHQQNKYNYASTKHQFNDNTNGCSELHRHKLIHQPRSQIKKRNASQLTPKKEAEMESNDLGYRLSIQNLSWGNNYSPTSRRAVTIGDEVDQGHGSYTQYSFAKKNQRQRIPTEKKFGEGEQFQLLNINSKIQKLREQINRQLDLIH